MTRLARVLCALLIVVGLPALSATPAQAVGEDGKFYDGRIAWTTTVNCPSLIMGASYTEYGAGAYVGYFADPDDGVPGVNQTVYMHMVFYGVGQTCGGSYFYPSFKLPAGVSVDGTQPILCYYDGVQKTVNSTECPNHSYLSPGTGPNNSTRYSFGGSGTWGVANGHFWEFKIPIKSTTTLSGSALKAYFEVIDGNDDPTLETSVPMYVFQGGGGSSGGVTVLYDQPSTRTSKFLPNSATPAKWGFVSEFTTIPNSKAGRILLQIGTSSGQYSGSAGLNIDAGYDSVTVATDWDEGGVDPLKPGKKYFWRGGFDPSGNGSNDVKWGSEQSFIAPTSAKCLGLDVTVNMAFNELPTAGNDVIQGTPGNDEINGNEGNDWVCALGGNDRVDLGLGEDLVDLGPGNDSVEMGRGHDAAKGGSGTDTVTYATATSGIVLDLGNPNEQNTSGGGYDIVTGFENATGSPYVDTIYGNSVGNVLKGLDLADFLYGLEGGDTLIGGTGTPDLCNGGPGSDSAKTCENKVSIP